jgi:hypothetical protein
MKGLNKGGMEEGNEGIKREEQRMIRRKEETKKKKIT